MIRISQLKLNIHHTQEDLEEKILKTLSIPASELISFSIMRRSLDARKKSDIMYSYTIDVEVADERHVKNKSLIRFRPEVYIQKTVHNHGNYKRPVVIGTGPAGLFCGLCLARAGLQPLLIERGAEAAERKKIVDRFWETGELSFDTNVCFGEGGAGTFSDGKLNTLVKDEGCRNFEVLSTLVNFGADSEILYLQKPHIGTDKLIEIITGIRKEIERLGGEVRFNTALTDIESESGTLKLAVLSDGSRVECDKMVLATGHSARDVYSMLRNHDISMQKKAFAVGLRIQHPQKMIDTAQFGEKEAEFLSPAAYKLTAKAGNGRGVYTFCMCPGGYVVDASTENRMKCVNGMSYHDRASHTANSAIIVQVGPDDYCLEGQEPSDPLAGIEFQRRLERAAFAAGDGSIPIQLLGDYLQKRDSTIFGDVEPCFKGAAKWARLDEILPQYIHNSIAEVIPEFDRKTHGFGRSDAILAGVESRTSSPVRICRDETFMSSISGLYPCGEGAGYAGGIMSAAMDGLRVAEKIIDTY